jgi:hypothetical protein
MTIPATHSDRFLSGFFFGFWYEAGASERCASR